MTARAARLPRWAIAALAGLALLIGAAGVFYREDILRTGLDPRVPFQTYTPPPAPDYAQTSAWALAPAGPARPGDPPADVFFLSPTTYDGGDHWNAPIDEPKAERQFRRVMAPNYVGPFVRVGRVWAPRYRQASLYSLLTLREDAREARRFAYEDVARAFRHYAAAADPSRPLVLVGVEQGGTLTARLLAEEVMPDPVLRGRLAAAYLIEAAVPAASPPAPPCLTAGQTGCVAAWVSAFEDEPERVQAILNRSLIWRNAHLDNLLGEAPLCFNPLLGAVTDEAAAARLNLGAANATDLEWGARPAFLTRQVGAQCKDGVLRLTRPKSPSLKPTGSWADRRKVPGYNLFYANLEADAEALVEALAAAFGAPVSPRP